MPAGDLITGDWQVELRAFLMGSDVPATAARITLAPPGVTGLGNTAPKTYDVDLEGVAGAYASPDREAPRATTWPFEILASSAGEAMEVLTMMRAAWATSTGDIPLYAQLPGWGKFHLNGRPRGMQALLGDLKSGVVNLLCTFYSLDPSIWPG